MKLIKTLILLVLIGLGSWLFIQKDSLSSIILTESSKKVAPESLMKFLSKYDHVNTAVTLSLNVACQQTAKIAQKHAIEFNAAPSDMVIKASLDEAVKHKKAYCPK